MSDKGIFEDSNDSWENHHPWQTRWKKIRPFFILFLIWLNITLMVLLLSGHYSNSKKLAGFEDNAIRLGYGRMAPSAYDPAALEFQWVMPED